MGFELCPQAFPKAQVEGLGSRVDRHETGSPIAGAGTDQQDASSPPFAHLPTEVMAAAHNRQDIAVYLIDPGFDILVQETGAVGVRSRIADKQPHLTGTDGGGDAVQGIR